MNKIIKEVEKILKDASIEEYKKEAIIITEEISGLGREKLLLEENINNKDKIMDIALNRAKTHKPLQYLLGYTYFMNEKYFLNKNVLIPRDETELLVLEGFKLVKNKKDRINILDIGVGSGIISCSLAKLLNEKDIEILAIDISSDAIKTALENASRLDLIKKVVFRKSDIFSKIREEEKFDLIISNPPYIPKKEKDNLQFEVRNFEPEIALFTDDKKGIEFYKRIIKDARKYLKKDGFLAFELGINQAGEVEKMLKKDYKNIQIIKDISGIERVICAQINNQLL